MLDTVDSLVLDLLEWIGPGSRPYGEVLDAWRTSCPRLPVWENANDQGLVVCHRAEGRRLVSVTPAGRMQLRELRPNATAVASAEDVSRDNVPD
jgi:D-3-phosphoglycerate dehydrogenase